MRHLLGVVVFSITAVPSTAHAQETVWAFCYTVAAPYYKTSAFEIDSSMTLPPDKYNDRLLKSSVASDFSIALKDSHPDAKSVYCRWFESKAQAEIISTGASGAEFGWQPNGGPLQSPVQSITYAFQSVNAQTRRGYRNATIKLNYRFLQCADEIQIAYSMDAKSLDYDPRRYDYWRKTNIGTGGSEVSSVTTTTPADAPTSIPINLDIHRTGAGAQQTIAVVRDATANEALGMGCFSGQTKRVGLISKLLGANATKADIRALLKTLSAGERFNNFNMLPIPLLNSGAILPDEAVPDRSASPKSTGATTRRSAAAARRK